MSSIADLMNASLPGEGSIADRLQGALSKHDSGNYGIVGTGTVLSYFLYRRIGKIVRIRYVSLNEGLAAGANEMLAGLIPLGLRPSNDGTVPTITPRNGADTALTQVQFYPNGNLYARYGADETVASNALVFPPFVYVTDDDPPDEWPGILG